MLRLIRLAGLALVLTLVAKPLNAQISGTLETHTLESEIFGNRRQLRVWLPPGYHSADNDLHYPVLYLNDGQNLFDDDASTFNGLEWRVDETATRLVEAGLIEPLIVVGIDNAGKRGRAREYLPYPDRFLSPPQPDPQGRFYGRFLEMEVLPFVNVRYRTRTGPENTALGGSSYGALIALYAALTTPKLASRVLLESPSFYVAEGRIFRDLQASDSRLTQVYLGVGTNELNRPDCESSEENREPVNDVEKMAAALESRGMESSSIRVVIEPCAVHDEEAWSRRLPAALQFLFAPPAGSSKPPIPNS